MILWEDEALVLSTLNYSETSIILKIFTKNNGLRKGLVKGAKSKNKNFIFQSGNLVNVSYKSRTEDMLGMFTVDLISSCSAIYLSDTQKFSGIVSILNLIEFSLLENEVEKELYDHSKALINKIITSEKNWIVDYIKWEIFLLKKIGFGLELSKCVLTNKKSNLKCLSPKSGCAVNEKAAEKWKHKLYIIPNFFLNDKKANKEDLINGFNITSNFLKKFAKSINKTLPFTRSNFIDIILTKQ